MKNKFQLNLGDCLDVLKTLSENSVDSVVTDPPYGLKFMGKRWDYDVPSVEVWREVLRVLKPGGYLLSFGGTRTYHRMVVNIEDAGFEVRDQIQWLYGSGFPKSLDISKAIDKQAGAEREVIKYVPHTTGIQRNNSLERDELKGGNSRQGKLANEMMPITTPSTDAAKQWSGWGTALKPANEPIVLARKPLSEKTVAENVLKWGTGGLNIDASRVDGGERILIESKSEPSLHAFGNGLNGSRAAGTTTQGRFPANIILDETAAEMLDEQTKDGRAGKPSGTGKLGSAKGGAQSMFGNDGAITARYDDSVVNGASRFFYVAKASKRERNLNCERILTWENQDQSLQELTVELNQLAKGTSEYTMSQLRGIEWNTLLSGKEITDKSLLDFKFTISTAIKLITELKTSNYSPHSSTKENILDAIRTNEENGLNLAESVELTNQLMVNTTKDTMVSALGAVTAVLKTLLKIRNYAKQGNVHSTVKPIRLMEYLIKLITPPGGTVLDPFLGSGTTGIACLNTDFKFIGVEREQSYFEIAKERIENTAKRLDTVEKVLGTNK